jgi:hypothetical protein
MFLINNYLILENALENPDSYVDLAKSLTYYNAENRQIEGIKIKTNDEFRPPGKWRGHRSDSLDKINYDLFRKTFDNIFQKVINPHVRCSFEYQISSYFNYSPETVHYENKGSWWHTDHDNAFAGIIYLTKNPKKNSGTLIMINDKEYSFENEFNRLVMYNGNILHRPENCFGNTIDDTRLTLTFFVNILKLEINNKL